MIPKIIHYCWFGGKRLSEDAKRYIASWQKLCPDYKIMEWNESNFDVKMVPYVNEAYEEKKWAFVSDYVRLYALKNYGGIYLDTDVEMIKSMDVFLSNKSFIGAESKYSICTAVIGAEKNALFINELLKIYDGIHFLDEKGLDTMPNSQRIFKFLESEYNYKDSDKPIYLNNCTIYPKDYFSPINCYTFEQKNTINTYCVHRYAGTWKSEKEIFLNRLKAFVTRIVGEDFRNSIKERQTRKGKEQ